MKLPNGVTSEQDYLRGVQDCLEWINFHFELDCDECPYDKDCYEKCRLNLFKAFLEEKNK